MNPSECSWKILQIIMRDRLALDIMTHVGSLANMSMLESAPIAYRLREDAEISIENRLITIVVGAAAVYYFRYDHFSGNLNKVERIGFTDSGALKLYPVWPKEDMV